MHLVALDHDVVGQDAARAVRILYIHVPTFDTVEAQSGKTDSTAGLRRFCLALMGRRRFGSHQRIHR